MIKITGPHLDKKKKHAGAPKCWYLYWTTPLKNADGTVKLVNDAPELERHRPYYATRAEAEADKARIEAQYERTGSGEFIFDRTAAADYEAAKKIVGNVPLVEIARFWRLHHPEQPKQKISELYPLFIADAKERLGETRHIDDLDYRVGIYVATAGERYPDTVTRADIMTYLKALKLAPRTRRNHKQSICRFFNWLLDTGHVTSNPAAGIKKRMLPKETRSEIRFLKFDQTERYLRAAERYDPDLVAHEVVQLLAGVRADDEMANFDAKYVLPDTKEVVVPESIAKMDERDVIEGLEDCFWSWWSVYGKEEGLLRVKNYEPRWYRIRVLASILDQARADELARLPIKTLLKLEIAKNALKEWPWNARRRTFCTHHIAKHKSADKTAEIMRHHGSTYTLHNSYKGLGVTQAKGVMYFEIQPCPVAHPIRPELPLRGIVRKQAERVSAAYPSIVGSTTQGIAG
jgi:hypothetical protein